MENASKALIIAGSILVSILLISLGIVIFNKANPRDSEIEEVDMQTFNQKFLSYEGNKDGAEVRSLVQKVRANNANDDNKEVREVGIVFQDKSGKEDSQIKSITYDKTSKTTTDNVKTEMIKTNQHYNVTMKPDSDGLIHEITVKAVQ